MPTYAFTRTREQMRDMIARKLGIKEAGQTMGGEDAAIIYEAMDLRLKELHSLGILWWQVSAASTSVSLVSGTATATISPTDYLFPVSLMLTVATDEQPIEIIGHAAYMAIPDKTSQGDPVQAYISGSTIRLWPVPQQNYTAKLTYQAIAADVENGVAPDVPVSMMRAFSDVVAGDLVEDWPDIDPIKAARLMSKGAIAIRQIRALNSERVQSTTVETEYF